MLRILMEQSRVHLAGTIPSFGGRSVRHEARKTGGRYFGLICLVCHGTTIKTYKGIVGP